jgi:hypothetical protein
MSIREEKAPMDEVDRFLCDGNISRFSDQLRYETIPARQETLKRLLIEEENRLGSLDDRLSVVQRKLMEGAELIVRQKRLIAQMTSCNGETGSAERTLRTFEMIQDLFERFRDQIYYERELQRP